MDNVTQAARTLQRIQVGGPGISGLVALSQISIPCKRVWLSVPRTALNGTVNTSVVRVGRATKNAAGTVVLKPARTLPNDGSGDGALHVFDANIPEVYFETAGDILDCEIEL